MPESTENSLNNEQIAKIIAKAGELFLQLGLRAVTMEDVAKELGMSKKTIYSLFDNKADLIMQVVKADMMEKECSTEALVKANHDAVKEMLFIGQQVATTLRTFSLNIIHELNRFYPEVWTVIEEHKSSCVYQTLLDNVAKGREQGYYRDNFDTELVVRLYIATTDCIIQQGATLRTKYNIGDVYYQHVLHHLHSICNENGRTLLTQHLKTIEF